MTVCERLDPEEEKQPDPEMTDSQVKTVTAGNRAAAEEFLSDNTDPGCGDLQARLQAAEAELAVLRARERYLAEGLDNLSVAVFLLSEDLRVLYSNPQAEILWCLPPGTFARGAHLRDALLICAGRGDLGSGDPHKLAEETLEDFRGVPRRDYERRNYAGRWLRIEKRRLSDGSLLCSYTDITSLEEARDARQKTEQDLQRTSGILRTVVDALPVGVLAWDRNYRCQVLNSALPRILDFPPGLVREGGSLDEGLRFQAERGDFGPGPVEQCLKEAREFAFVSVPEGYERHFPDGRIIMVRRDRLPDGGMVAVYSDITIQAGVEEQVRANEEAMRRILDEAPAAVSVLDPGGRRLWTNRRAVELLGATSREELLSMPVVESFGDRLDYDGLQKMVYSRGIEVPRRRPDGGIWWAELHSRPMIWNGTEANLIWCFDISARKKAEEHLRQHRDWLEKLDQQKNRLFSVIAHDLRGPFNALIGLSELLRSNAAVMDPEQISRDAALMHQSCKQFMTLLDSLLDWARAQMDHHICLPENVRLDREIAPLLDVYVPMAESKGVRIENRILPSDVLVDPGMLQSVLRNLIGNAIKFTPEGGVIRLSSSQGPEFLCLSVEDTGIGFSPDRIDRLFEMGWLDSTAGTDGETGTGLGLALSKELVERNGGQIRLVSSPGAGSRFEILLPRAPEKGHVALSVANAS